jgi:Ca2+-binding RTX toxin-like protein
MTKTIITKYQHDAIEINGSHNSLIVSSEGVVISFDDNIDAVIQTEKGTTNNSITINGSVLAGIDAAALGILMQSDNSKVIVGESGVIDGLGGIFVDGNHVSVMNAGHISSNAGAVAILINQNLTGVSVVNKGTLSGLQAGINVLSDGTVITNEADGKIITEGFGVVSQENAMKVVNHGLIKGEAGSIGATSNLTIVNDGKLVGDVVFGNGPAVLDMRGGTIVGDIMGGAGQCMLITDNAKFKLTEEPNSGFDTVKSTVSYTLSDNVERLVLLGKKDINATGNDDNATDNFLIGNSGNNVLTGRGGLNLLLGNGGSDDLIGGQGFDLFGIGRDYGHDTARHYSDGSDLIFLDNIHLSFSQLKSHIEQHGNDTWIDFGEDVLVLKGINHRVLDHGDFTSTL